MLASEEVSKLSGQISLNQSSHQQVFGEVLSVCCFDWGVKFFFSCSWTCSVEAATVGGGWVLVEQSLEAKLLAWGEWVLGGELYALVGCSWNLSWQKLVQYYVLGGCEGVELE